MIFQRIDNSDSRKAYLEALRCLRPMSYLTRSEVWVSFRWGNKETQKDAKKYGGSLKCM